MEAPNFLKKKEEVPAQGGEEYKSMEQDHADKIKQAITLLQEVLSGEEAEAGEMPKDKGGLSAMLGKVLGK